MKTLLEKVINQVIDHKAEADLILSSGKSLKMSAQKGAISTYNVSSTQILGVRLIKDGRVGLSYTESLDEESLRFMVSQALQNAETSEPNPDEQILTLSGSLVDELVAPDEEVTIAEKTQLALELEAAVRKMDARVTSVPYNSYSEQDYRSHYLSTSGRHTSYFDQSYTIVSSAVMSENSKKSSFYDFHTTHAFRDLNFDKVVDTAFNQAKSLLHEKTLPTGKYNIRFHPDCLKELLSCFANFFSAKASIDKLNPWTQQLGALVISPDISIIDHPLFDRSFRISRFDSEGVERKPLQLIEAGVLKAFYHNSVTARHFGTETTGHAARSATGPLGVQGTDLLVQGKNVKPAPTKYLEVIQMDGLYSGANRVTGAFSAAIKGHIWEASERVGTFGNITFSGNLMELLKNVEVTGTELVSSTDESFFTAPLIFHGVSVAGS
jgi:PmbA protein